MKLLHVLIESRQGQNVLADILEVLGHAQINVENIDAEALHSGGIITLTVDKYNRALRLLTSKGFKAISEEALITCVQDKPGALARVSAHLRDAGIGIRSIRILRRKDGLSTIGIVTDDNERARILLEPFEQSEYVSTHPVEPLQASFS